MGSVHRTKSEEGKTKMMTPQDKFICEATAEALTGIILSHKFQDKEGTITTSGQTVWIDNLRYKYQHIAQINKFIADNIKEAIR